MLICYRKKVSDFITNLMLTAMLNTDYRFGEVHKLASQIEDGTDKVHFKNIFENANGGVSLLAFKAGQALAEHLAPAEVMVYVIEGEVKFTMLDQPHVIKAGEFMLMGEDVRHSVTALADSKVILVKIRSDSRLDGRK